MEAIARRFHERQPGDLPERLVKLTHRDAEVALGASDSQPVCGRADIEAALGAERSRMIYSGEVEECEQLDEQTVLVRGQVRYALERGLAHSSVYWLDEFRDRLIWRVRAFRTEQEAREAHESVQAAAELQQRVEEAEKLAADLQAALNSRVIIEQAKSVLRERFDWTVEEAFEVLRFAARTARMNIHALAAEVVAREETPNPIIVAVARTERWRAALMRERAELQRVRSDQLAAAVREQQERLAWRQKERSVGRPRFSGT